MAAMPKPHTCACNATDCGKVAQGDEQGKSLKEILRQFKPEDLNNDLWFGSYLKNVPAKTTEQSLEITTTPPKKVLGTVDAKCLELEMTNTELLATPSACIRRRTIKIAMDSGAGDHVASPEDVEGFAIEESPNSKAGRNFVAANGGKIRNHGQATVRMRTGKGRKLASTFQVADVTRPLYSVSKLCDAGYDVKFSKKRATIMDEHGQPICVFARQGGLYVARMRLRNPKYRGFSMQGQ